MKILVPVKRVPDPELKTKIKDGAIDLTGATWVVNTFDEYAVEAALRLVENAADGSRHGEVVVVTIGPDGVGLTATTLHDESGPVGRAEQILMVRRTT
mgnify:CR=1 FL=1